MNLQSLFNPNHHRGKEVLDIYLLKAAAHEAVARQRLGLVPCTDDTRPEWVTYPYRNAHPILRWLPSKLAEWLSENLAEELAIPAKRGDRWTVEELNTVLENNLVASGSTGGHIRTFGAIQWECELYRGRPKARCYPFDLDGHCFLGKNPQVNVWLHCMLINMLYNLLKQDCVCLIAPFPNNPNQPEDFDPKYDMDISGNGLMWYARPQLFFNCTVCPTGKRSKKHSHLELSLVYFSTFEPINITQHSVMQSNGAV